MPEVDEAVAKLMPGAEALVARAERLREQFRHDDLACRHWLAALLDRHGPMAADVSPGLDADSVRRDTLDALERGDAGAPAPIGDVVGEAADRAAKRERPAVGERDLAFVILRLAGLPVGDAAPGGATTAGEKAAKVVGGRKRKTPALDHFGRDLTAEAAAGKLSPVVGRDLELDLVIETLCRHTKRNPVLVGPPGVGKTAIAEGLAQRVAGDLVPDLLKGARIVALQPSLLEAGAGVRGQFEERLQAILEEAAATGTILFFDEVHSLIGTGGAAGTGDAANMLKPALSRGELACVAATTDAEYRRYIEQDGALERRFQPIRVQEMTPSQTLGVLRTLRDQFRAKRNVAVGDEVLAWLVEFAREALHNRFFPDKAVDLLDQCVANALAQGKDAVTLATAEGVARRMVGMAVAVRERLETLRSLLGERVPLRPEDEAALFNRLEVTLRGLDIKPGRPNGVILLTGSAAKQADGMSRILAEALAGAAERVVSIDFAQFNHPGAITSFLGAGPSYVGYNAELPIHRLIQMPMGVLLAHNVDACDQSVLTALSKALHDGFLTDAAGKRIFLSEAMVVLTASLDPGAAPKAAFGFGADQRQSGAPADARKAVAAELGENFAEAIDVIITDLASSEDSTQRWLETALLPAFAARYRKVGVEVLWDAELVGWLVAQREHAPNLRAWERLVEDRLGPKIAGFWAEPGGDLRALLVTVQDQVVVVQMRDQ
ncbi:MAG: ATP-dependent Clp protease ATP-binding subunit [Candidatus Sericytochromatia bacterium]|nr:ATP-dependent Clp protease ATP-binding subunit [Candidatus Tanganyikabacteria bacterium]